MTLEAHIERTLAAIPQGMRLPAYSCADLDRLLRRGPIPLSPRKLANVLPKLGWRKHRVWRPDAVGRRRLVTLWVAPGATVRRNGIHPGIDSAKAEQKHMPGVLR